MQKKIPFFGTATALITPFSGGEIDYGALIPLIEKQLDAHIPALVLGGTTAEAATLSDTERYELYRRAIDRIGGRARVIVGTGTNDTRIALRHTREAERLGADATLVVTPYYNKGTARGIREHYRAIAEETALPIILYNVPSRTGVNLSIETLRALSEIPNIVAIKEASDSLDRLVEISTLAESLYLYAGNDSQIFPTLALGGMGVVSVASNLIPRTVESICTDYQSGRHEAARNTQRRLLPLLHALFCETNPTPVKYALWRLGLCENELRLPLAPLAEEHHSVLDALLADPAVFADSLI